MLPGGRATWGGATAPIDESVILETLQSMIPGIVAVDAEAGTDASETDE